MPLNLVLVPQRQSPKGMALSWSAMEGVSSYTVFVASRRLAPEELEAAQVLGGTDDCVVIKVGADVVSVVDDLTSAGETRFYGVAMSFGDGAVRSARFKALADGATADSFAISAARSRKPAAAAPARPAAAAAAPRPTAAATPSGNTGSMRVGTPAAASSAPVRPVAAPAPAPRPASITPASAETPPPPSSVPLDQPLDIRMSGGTQTWDGLRLTWEREPRAAAYEIIVSDHQIFGDEIKDALLGKADFTSAVAVAPSVTAVIDNVTAREARGWYCVLVRGRDGARTAHPFKVGNAAESGRPVAPFINPNRVGEVRAEAEDLVGQAQEQWSRWKSEQDGGARREARRMVQDALLIFPDYPAAKALAAEMG